ncbi:hypothetical protein [Yinghuangia sp. YIM S09857]|uniref:hypothetical protein n=1 Tax=Yinghuangia sp. YIM S09857 TaxID=3436929 RepID=UPI003F536012
MRRYLRRMLAEGDALGEFHTPIPWPSVWLFAKFAYCAEQFGYRYAGLAGDVPTDLRPPLHTFCRVSDAGSRAERTIRDYPRALRGGRMPGMYPWPVPLVARGPARREVRLLHARIKADYYGVVGWEPVRGLAVKVFGVVMAAVLVSGGVGEPLVFVAAGGLAAALILMIVLSKVFMRRRRASYLRLLERAGVAWPPPRGPGRGASRRGNGAGAAVR